MTDNSPPQLSFTNRQNRRHPDEIEAPVSDPYSGVASGAIYFRPVGSTSWQPLTTRLEGGALKAEVDSEAEPPGRYEFEAIATDAVGNTATTTKRADGTQMVLDFPLKPQVKLSGYLGAGSRRLTGRYGHDTKIRGRLTTARGKAA